MFAFLILVCFFLTEILVCVFNNVSQFQYRYICKNSQKITTINECIGLVFFFLPILMIRTIGSITLMDTCVSYSGLVPKNNNLFIIYIRESWVNQN